MKKKINSKVLSDVKISDNDVKKYSKKLTVLGKKKLAVTLIGGIALVGAAAGTASYFALNRNGTSIIEGSGTAVIDPTFKDATVTPFVTLDNGDRASIVSSETRKINTVAISVGSILLKEGEDYSVSAENDTYSSVKVTIFKATYEKYSNSGAFKISPVYAEKCLILFDTDGGSDVAPINVEIGQKAVKPNNPVKEGYEFAGWWFTSDEGQYIEFNFDNPINSNLILHAKWQIPVTTVGVGYHYDGTGYLVYCNDFEKLPEKVRIPETYTDPVTNITANVIGFYAYGEYDVGFGYCFNLKEITLPETIERIDEGAFYRCQLLEKINIPKNVKYIDDYAFSCCHKLTSINLPEGLISIGQEAFRWCDLETLVLPKSLQLLGQGAFTSNYNLINVVINEGLMTIPYECFYYCENLAQVTLPISVTSIEEDAFGDTWLNNVIIKDEFSEWESSDCVYSSKSDFVEALYDGFEVWKCSYADSDNKYNIQFMGYANDEHTKANCAIQYIGEDTEITIPDDSQPLKIDGYDIDFIPVRLDSYFDQTSKLTSATLNSNITSIAPYAFNNRSSLKSILFKDNNINLESVGEFAFFHCSSLSNFNSSIEGTIDLPASLSYLGDCCFTDCSSLKTVKINSNIAMNINNTVRTERATCKSFPFYFYPGGGKCNITSYIVNDNNDYYMSDSNTGALYSKVDGKINTLIAYPAFSDGEDKIVKIAEGAVATSDIALTANGIFMDVTEISIPASLENFNSMFASDNYYYGSLDSLVSFDVNSDNKHFVTSTDKATLYNYDKTELIKFASGSKTATYNYEIEDSVTKICKCAFAIDKNLLTIDLSNVKTIEDRAFLKCGSLKDTIDLSNIKEIGDLSFNTCTNIKTIHIGSDCSSIGEEAFYNVPAAAEIYIDSSIIANLSDDNRDNGSCLLKDVVYIKENIRLNSSSYISQNYDIAEEPTGGYYKCTAR